MRTEAKEILEGNPKLRDQSVEEAEKQGEQEGTDTLMFLRNLLLQQLQKGEI
jgi:hypothetical protein